MGNLLMARICTKVTKVDATVKIRKFGPVFKKTSICIELLTDQISFRIFFNYFLLV